MDPAKYGGIIKGFRVSLAEAGVRELGKGWAPTFFGYSMQGLGKFGLYEVFKIYYSMAIGEVNLRPFICMLFVRSVAFCYAWLSWEVFVYA